MKQQEKKEMIFAIAAIVLIIAIVTVIFLIGPTKPNRIRRRLIDQTAENIKFKNKKLNVYFFYGEGCPHCEELINYLNTLPEEYDDYFDLYTMEVWYDEENSKLMEEVLSKLNQEPSGVPCLIVEDQIFFGYSNKIGKEIKKAIRQAYNSKQRYDVYKECKRA